MEGSYVTLVLDGTAPTAKSGQRGAEGRVLRQRVPLPCFAGVPAREAGQITNDRHRFVPYPFKNKTWKDW
jgi:hypothetical protein